MSRNSILKVRLKEPVNRVLRSRKGHFYLADTIAITDEGNVEWLTGSNDSYSRFVPKGFNTSEKPLTLWFLDAVFEQGNALLEALCFPVDNTPPEQQLIEEFVASKVLVGEFRRNVMLQQARKQIDLI